MLREDLANAKTSMTVTSLNELVVRLRPTAKKCRTQIIQKLLRKIKLLKSKKGTPIRIELNIKKATKFQAEIEILKASDLDTLVKYCLCNKSTVKEVANKQDNLGDLAFTRVACQKLIKDEIDKWRNQHDDWESLALFIKGHISRRYKKKKQDGKGNKPKTNISHHQAANVDILQEGCVEHGCEMRTTGLNNNSDINAVQNSHILQNESTFPKFTFVAKVSKENITSTFAQKQSTNKSLETKDNETGEMNKKEIMCSDEIDILCSDDMVVKRCKMDEWIDVQMPFNVCSSDNEKSKVNFIASTSRKRKLDSFFEGGEDSDAEINFIPNINDHDHDHDNNNDDNQDPSHTSNDTDNTNRIKSQFITSLDENKKQSKINSCKNISKIKYRAENYSSNSKKFTNRNSLNNTKKFLEKDSQNPNFHRDIKYNLKSVSKKAENLHPSWEAKRKLKEKQTLKVQFQGKKYVFDD